ncbi:hypothetical protein [Maridesulfovibrio sp.]|uniref:hypothetical protein n=1 Tax=Maridesulfovibrio sp. TaxID=2795000 RepID=UPI002A18C6C0|nr:hypothetical protein [Maridesulfovibrio sp.]
MIEIFRRVSALFLLCLGGYLMIWPGGKLLIVSLYEGSTIESQRITVTTPAWFELAASMTSPEGVPELEDRAYGYNHKRYIFKPDEPPFNEISHYPEQAVFVSIGSGQKWLRIYASHPGDIYSLPEQFKHPYFYHGPGLIMLGFAIYFFIPRRQYETDEIHYPRGATVIVPDIMGLILTPIFFLLPFLIVWEMDAGGSVLSLSKGWIWLTGTMWLMAAIWSVLLLTALKYSDLCYRITDQGLHVVKRGKDKLIKWHEIEYFRNYRTRLGGKISTLLLILGTTLQALATGLMLRHQEEWGIRIHPSKGKEIKIMGNALDQFDEIVRALKDHGVKRKNNK